MVVWNDLSNTQWLDYPSQSNILRRTYVNGFLDVSHNIIARKDIEVHGEIRMKSVNTSESINASDLSVNSINANDISVNTINASGNVGIGTTSSIYNLDIYGGSNDETGANYNAARFHSGPLGTGTSTTYLRLERGNYGGAIGGFITQGSGAGLTFSSVNGGTLNERMRIHHNGNVGIGTDNPLAKLHIDGTDTIVRLNNQTSSGRSTLMFDTDDADWEVGARGSTNGSAPSSFYIYDTDYRMVINASGNVGIGTNSPSRNFHIHNSSNAYLQITSGSLMGTGATDGFHIVSAGATKDVYLTQRESANMIFNTNNAEKMRITSSGNVGIGTNNPISKLHINGISSTTTGLTLENSTGSNRSIDFLNSNNLFRMGFAYDNDSVRLDIVNRNRDKKFTFTESGRVGIGKTNPAALLDVNGSMRAAYDSNTASYFGRTAIGYTGHDGWAALSHVNCNTRERYALLQSYDGQTLINTPSNQSIRFRVNNSDKMVMNSSGNVGIGTTSPTEKLHVQGSMRVVTAVKCSWAHFYSLNNSGNGFNGTQLPGVYIGTYNTAQYGQMQFATSSGDSWLDFVTTSGGNNDYRGRIRFEAGRNRFVATPSIVNSSDDRVKHNEKIVTNAMTTINKLTAKRYFKTLNLYDASHNFDLDSSGNPIIETDASGNPTERCDEEIGFIAQDIEKIPELKFCVIDVADVVDSSGNVEKQFAKGLDYNNIFTLSIAGLQEVHNMLISEKEKVATLETENSSLKTQINDILARLSTLEGGQTS